MIYWYTGQPGHGKTLHAIARALEFKAQGRRVFVCNVRQFDYTKAGMEELTPDQFKDWMNVLPDGAVALVDECYEHGMLPKMPPGAAVPAHIEQLAKHRHRGLDFIFVCQSPDKQCHVFTHDLIESHTHVRRRFGTSFVHLRVFDRYEKNPEKAHPIRLERKRLPKHVFGLYQSTELDTTERKIPWYFIATAVGVPLALGLMYYTFGNMGERLGGEAMAATGGAAATKTTEPLGDGGAGREAMTAADYIARFTPRIPSQPWSAPAYDDLSVSSEPPRLFCMLSGAGLDANGEAQDANCTCLTEQGTRYLLPHDTCRVVAMNGQYEPYFEERGTTRADGVAQQREYSQRLSQERGGVGGLPPTDAPSFGAAINAPQVSGYGGFGASTPSSAP